MTDEANLLFLPWVQRGGSAALRQTDTLGPEQPGVALADVTVRVNDLRDVTKPVSLVGPGHITALQPGQVIRTDPTRGSRVFEPNYLALVEFDEPSLPWLFTPSAANTDGKLRPWLCLVVVRKQEGVRLDAPQRGSLPVLRIDSPARPTLELPDLADSWAWAHAQVTAESGATESRVQTILSGSPEQSLSRLLCGRILEPQTDYLACVVPTFELGRRAGIGEPIDAEAESRLDPAWVKGDDLKSVALPVYHYWDFATGEGGDFQSLAMLLRARTLPEGVGVRPFDVSQSGVDVGMSTPTLLELGGALRPVDGETPQWTDEELHDQFRSALAALLNLAVDPATDPVLAPPRYGAVQAGLEAVDPARAGRWFEELNLEPAMRFAAQLGTRVVQDQQETLMAAAWEQAADYRAVERLLRHAQLGYAVARSLHGRHLLAMDPSVGLQVLAPATPRITRDPQAHRPDTGLVSLLAGTGLTTSAYSTTLRRIARPQGAINRRIQRFVAATGGTPVPRTTRVVPNLQPFVFAPRSRIVSTVGPVTIEAVALSLAAPREDITWREATAFAVQGAAARPTFAFESLAWPRPSFPVVPRPLPVSRVVVAAEATAVPRATARSSPGVTPGIALRRRDDDEPFPPLDPDPPVDPDPDPQPDPLPPRVDSAAAQLFRKVASAHLQRFFPSDPPLPRPLRQPADLHVVYDAALALTAPKHTFAASVGLLVDVVGAVPADDGAPAGEPALNRPSFAPIFPQPMASSLVELGQELLLPGLEKIPPNTVVPLATNTPFVEAYLVGLNTEFGRELLWREFPAPPRSTYFDRFWDTSIFPDAPPDIDALVTWGNRALGTGTGVAERFVMLLRSELLRRYPNAIVYATKPDADPPNSYPLFSGSMEPDVRFFGFDLSLDQMRERSLVIQEQPSAPRFGIEVGDDPGAGTHLAATGSHSAELAQRLRQFPVRITIPAAVLLTPPPDLDEDEDPA